ncbi:MAG: hypothetical protein J6D34_10650 [Atopobiaceae bacterium]|nr:hypothetical protein [Atopobiaceae bacterium]
MNLHEELMERLAHRRSAQLGGLSPAAYAELLLTVRESPSSYVDDPHDQAFMQLVDAVDRVLRSRDDDEFRDDESFMEERTQRMARFGRDCAQALAVAPDSIHARLLRILASDYEPDRQLDELLELDRSVDAELGPMTLPESGDAWTDVFLRGRLRIKAALSRTCLDSARYRMANDYGQALIADSPCDALGARHTCALSLARLEDEEGFEALDARFDRRGDSWQQLGRTILFYKLGRMPAARRALMGFANLCEGGPYALLRPVMVDTYLPDRPAAEPYSFAEVTLAVHEADPVVCDVPDFCAWAEQQANFGDQARIFAERNGFGW